MPRWGDRPRPPDRRLRGPAGPAPGVRAAAAGRRHRGRRAVRWWWSGRRPDPHRVPDGPRCRVPSPRWWTQARAGRPRAIGRLVSLVESDRRAPGPDGACSAPDTGRARVIGLTGPPGVGKSDHGRGPGHRPAGPGPAGGGAGRRPELAVLRRRAARRPGADAAARPGPGGVHPVDGYPRPPWRPGGGGDAGDPGARRGRLRHRAGGDRRRRPVRGRRRRSGAATLVLLAPGMGDGIQAAKAGVLEIGDLFVVNKADRDGAHAVVRELRNMVALAQRARRTGSHQCSPPARVDGIGIAELLEALDRFGGARPDLGPARPTPSGPRSPGDRAAGPVQGCGRRCRPQVTVACPGWRRRWPPAASTRTRPRSGARSALSRPP